jgi:4-hydroxythreonine-4-phosphate dehydrogenase
MPSSPAPISKKALSLAGYPFPGHTEFLAHLASCDDFAMAFVAPSLRVALLTTHVSLAQVPSLVKKQDLERLIRLVDRELRKFGFTRPRIALAAINPHAGEGGLFGSEEENEMRPAVEACRAAGEIDVSGPFPGDTVFVRASRGEFDIVISCYHDQGLIPIKCLSFNEAVNVTIGLPFIRTSVDHGTAFDIAGQGIANHASMIAAVRLAIDLCLKRI